MNNGEFKKIVLDKMQRELKVAGFRKKGSTFSAERDDVYIFVQLQSSRMSDKDVLIATVNLGIFSRVVALKLGNTSNPNILESHWQKRLGRYLTFPRNKWWKITSHDQAGAAGEKIARILKRRALPELLELASTTQLRSLWEAGICPGITDYQRQQYLRILIRPEQEHP
jgi:hypothetical protein